MNRRTESHADRRIQKNRIRRRREIRRNVLLSVVTFCFAITLAFGLNGFLSNAKSTSEAVSYKYYTSIQVERGETLWSIAQDNMGSYYETAEDYVAEVMRMNSLEDEKIITGQHLIIPYYSEEFVG